MYRSGPNHIDNPLEYRAWTDMKTRCYNSRFKDYKLYGGRGIKVCIEWLHSFVRFYSDMGPKPTPAHSLDRWPNQDGNYEPANCRWATPQEQARNFKRNRKITHSGKTQTLGEWASETGIKREVIADRLNRGWPEEQALTVPLITVRSRDDKGMFL